MPPRSVESEGQRLLIAWIKADPSRSQASVATAVGVTDPAVSAWVKGHSRPEPHLRLVIEVLASIPATAWETEEERRVREDKVAKIRAAANDATAHDSGEHAAVTAAKTEAS